MRRFLLVVAVILVVVLAAPFLVPTSAWLPQVALIASEKLGQPVAIAALELHLAPTPRLVARDIRVGRAGEAAIGELEIIPELRSLVSGPTTLRLVRAKRVALQEGALAILDGVPKGSGGGIEVTRVELEQVKLAMPDLDIPEFNLVADFAAGTRFEEARLAARDGSVYLRIVPQPRGALGLEIDARRWTPPGTPLRFETLTAKGRFVRGTSLELHELEGQLYGGALAGGGRVEWGPPWRIAGKLALDGVDLHALQGALGVAPRLTGRLKSEAAFTLESRTAAGLLETISLDGPFEVLGGAYRGIDLASVGDLTASAGQEEATRFEQFKGTLALRALHVSIQELCVRSPQLVAAGRVEVSAAQRLSGNLDVSLAKAERLTRVPVVLGGTTDEPTVRLSKGYVIGAVVGTLLMPGIGTGLGASAGSALSGRETGCR